MRVQKKVAGSCTVCGKEFLGNRGRKYCAYQCWAKVNRQQSNPKQEKSCQQCGKTYETRNPDRVFCNGNCKLKHQRANAPKAVRQCNICSKEIVGGWAQQCSRECYNKDYRNRHETPAKPPVEGNCKHCGKTFTGRPGKVWCHANCRHAAMLAAQGKEYKPRATRVKVCPICNKDFEGRADKLCCSKLCYLQHLEKRKDGLIEIGNPNRIESAPKLEGQCLVCSKPFVGRPEKKYCSRVCCRSFHNKRKRVDNFDTQGICLKCGKDFVGRWGKKYCCRQCKIKAAGERVKTKPKPRLYL